MLVIQGFLYLLNRVITYKYRQSILAEEHMESKHRQRSANLGRGETNGRKKKCKLRRGGSNLCPPVRVMLHNMSHSIWFQVPLVLLPLSIVKNVSLNPMSQSVLDVVYSSAYCHSIDEV